MGKNKRVIGMIKDEFSGEIMKEFSGLRPKMQFYKKDNGEEKKAKDTKNV